MFSFSIDSELKHDLSPRRLGFSGLYGGNIVDKLVTTEQAELTTNNGSKISRKVKILSPSGRPSRTKRLPKECGCTVLWRYFQYQILHCLRISGELHQPHQKGSEQLIYVVTLLRTGKSKWMFGRS